MDEKDILSLIKRIENYESIEIQQARLGQFRVTLKRRMREKTIYVDYDGYVFDDDKFSPVLLFKDIRIYEACSSKLREMREIEKEKSRNEFRSFL